MNTTEGADKLLVHKHCTNTDNTKILDAGFDTENERKAEKWQLYSRN